MGENPKKYHITDDGDIYRVNEDGSFTSMGNAEDKHTSESAENESVESSIVSNIKHQKPESKSRTSLIFSLSIVLAVLLFTLFYFVNDRQQSEKIESQTDVPEQSEENVEIQQDTVIKTHIEISSQATIKNKTDEHVSKNIEPSINNVNTKREAFQEVVITTDPTATIDLNKIYNAVEVQAEFPGGDRARLQWLRDNIQWPRDAEGRQLHGDVELQFVIERDGSVSNVKVIYSENPALNSAAIDVIGSMPKWSPAQVKNQPVRSTMGITLFF